MSLFDSMTPNPAESGSLPPLTPPGGAEPPLTPPGGAEPPLTPPGGAEPPLTPPGGAEPPLSGAEPPPSPPGGLAPESVGLDPDEIVSVGETTIMFDPGELTSTAKEKIKDFAQQLSNEQATATISYQRKMSELAQQEKALADISAITNQQLAIYARGAAMQDAMSNIQQTLTDDLWGSDPDQARKLSDMYQKFNFQLSQASEAWREAERTRTNALETERQRRRQAGAEQLNRKYPGFSQRVVPKLVHYAESLGVQKEDAQDYAIDPTAAEIMYKAMRYDEMRKKVTPGKKQSAARPQVPTQKTPAKQPSLQQMTDAEFAKYLASN